MRGCPDAVFGEQRGKVCFHGWGGAVRFAIGESVAGAACLLSVIRLMPMTRRRASFQTMPVFTRKCDAGKAGIIPIGAGKTPRGRRCIGGG